MLAGDVATNLFLKSLTIPTLINFTVKLNMELRAELLHITAGGRRIAILNDETASTLGVHSSDRIKISCNKNEAIAIANIAVHFPKNRIGLYEEIAEILNVQEDEKTNGQRSALP